MKKLSLNIKKIALSLLVVGLAIGAQSFKSAKKPAGFFATDWYAVDPDGDAIDPTPLGSAPSGPACQLEFEGSVCVIQLTTDGAIPETVSAAHTTPGVTVGDEYKRND